MSPLIISPLPHYITPPTTTLYHPSHNYNYNYITPPTKNITSSLPQLFAPIFLPQIYFSKLIPMHQKFTPDTTRGTADPDYWVRNLSSDQTYKNNWEYSIILRLVPFLLIVCLFVAQSEGFGRVKIWRHLYLHLTRWVSYIGRLTDYITLTATTPPILHKNDRPGDDGTLRSV